MIKRGSTVLVLLTIRLLATLQLPRMRKSVCILLLNVLSLNLHVCMTEMAVGGDPVMKQNDLTIQTSFLHTPSNSKVHRAFELVCSV